MDANYIYCGRSSCDWEGFDTELVDVPVNKNLLRATCPKCGCDNYWAEKPLFIPLCEKPYREFEAGTKQNMEEYRPEGPRWNAKKCRIGRKVVLSLGYGKKHRKTGRIVGYRTASVAEIPQWSTYYGTHPGPVAAIKIELDQP